MQIALATGPSQQLNFKNTQTMQNAACQTAHGPTGFASLILDTNICGFSGTGLGVCRGDNGGPLTSGTSLIGLVSFASGCGAGFPDVYTRVSAYSDWIMQNTV